MRDASVRSIATLRKAFDAFCLRHPIEPAVKITDAGVMLGAGTLLMRMEDDQLGLAQLARLHDEARLFALLAVARDILAAVAPINALPWPPETEE